jgi:hypothetical protein
MKVEGDEFALVSNFAGAQAICQMFKRVVIDKDTLLRFSLTEEGSNLLYEENGAAWHSCGTQCTEYGFGSDGGETGYFKERSGHQEFVQAKKTGAVWCKLAKQETSPTFEQGTYIWSDGSKYEGEFKDGKPNGQGTLISPDGYKYVGQWKDGKQDGQGNYYHVDGGRYVGEWKNGRRNGQGNYYYTERLGRDGARYVGEWKNGRRNGQGNYYYTDGARYVGEWKNGKFHGQGTLTWANGDKYEGEWKDGGFHGQGTLTYSYPCCGQKYGGEWKDGKFHGQGTFTWSDGYIRAMSLKGGIVSRVDKGEFKYGRFTCWQLITSKRSEYYKYNQNDSIKMGWCKDRWGHTAHFLRWEKQKKEIALPELNINFPVN